MLGRITIVSLTVQVFDNPIAYRGERFGQYIFVFFKQRHPESLKFRAERRNRNDTNSLCTQQVVNKPFVKGYRVANPVLNQAFYFLIINRDVLVGFQRTLPENDRIVKGAEGFIEC